jgi:hypothetical protein
MSNYITITMFPDVFAKTLKQGKVTWEQLCKQVEEPKVYPWKKSMPLIKLATFGDAKTKTGSLRSDENVLEVFGIEGDYDAEKVSMADAATLLKKRGVKAILFTSPSATLDKPRFRILCPFSQGREPEERHHYTGLLNAAVGGILAPESFTLSQSYYFGKGSNYYEYIIVDGEPIDMKEGQWDGVYPNAKNNDVSGDSAPRSDRIADAIRAIYANENYYRPALSLTALYFNSGMSRADAIATVKSIMQAHPNPNGDIDKYIADVDGFLASEDFKDRQLVITPEAVAKTVPAPIGNTYTMDKKGKIEPTQANLLRLLANYQLRYDEFRATYMGLFDGVVRVLDEADYARIQYKAEQMGFAKISTAMVRENVLMVCSNNTFDSAIEWGNSLVWDGVPRCETLLQKYFGADDTPYVTAASLYIASAMGGRLMEPGCKADAAIVLVGSQGAGKTVSINALAPMPDTFVEISLHSRDSDLSRHLRGKLVGELAELRGLKSKDAEDIKAWMSRTTEEWVPKYMEFTKTFKRRLTFWGSTNDNQFLNDVTGNRRWLPIKVNNPKPDLIKQDCLQIWAEAVDIFKNFGVLWQVVQELAEEARSEHFDEDPFVEDVREFLELKSAIDKFTGKEIWYGIGKIGQDFDHKAAGQVKRAMLVLGWEHKKIRQGNKSLKGYVRK